MKPLIVLLIVFILAALIRKGVSGKYEWIIAARIGMSAMLIFTAVGHFMFPEGMALMVPDFIPYPRQWVYITAFLEILAAVGIQIPSLRPVTGWLLIVFFILVLPANIKAAMENINYQEGTYDGPGILYLWFRIPLQVLLIVWVYVSTVRST